MSVHGRAWRVLSVLVAVGSGCFHHMRLPGFACRVPVHSLLQGFVPCIWCCGRWWWWWWQRFALCCRHATALVNVMFIDLAACTCVRVCACISCRHHCSCCVCQLWGPQRSQTSATTECSSLAQSAGPIIKGLQGCVVRSLQRLRCCQVPQTA